MWLHGQEGETMKKAVPGGVNVKLALLSGLVLLVVLVVTGLWYKDKEQDLETVFHSTLQKQEIVSRMRISLLKSAELEKAAVMADTDPLSRSLADQSLQAAEETDRQRRELNRLIEHDSLAEEVALLKEFDHCWSQSRKIDAVLLDFAVENTNLKAARLSFTTAGKALELFQQRLTDFLGSMASNERELPGGQSGLCGPCGRFQDPVLARAPHRRCRRRADGRHGKADGSVSGGGEKLPEGARGSRLRRKPGIVEAGGVRVRRV